MRTNNVDYFERVIKLFRDLKSDNPDIDISKHYLLATSESNGTFLTDKELYQCLQRHKTELDINTLSDKDLDKVITDTEELFKEVDVEDEEEEPWKGDSDWDLD